MRCVVMSAVVFLLALVGPAAVAAQDASPMASPAAGECVAPPLPPGTPTPPDATPAPVGDAPEPPPIPVGTPADGALLERLRFAEVNLANCINGHNWLAVAALMTPRAILVEVWGEGVTNPYDLPAKAESVGGAQWIEIFEVTDAQTHADGRISNELLLSFDHGQPVRTRDFWVEQDGWLIFDEFVFIELVEPQAGTPAP